MGNMMRKLLSSLALGMLVAPGALACDCNRLAETFEKTVQLHNEKYGERSPLTVVTGTVLKHENFRKSYQGDIPRQMSFAVRKVVQGTVKAEVITIKGDDGRLCRPYVTRFPEGTDWTLAVQKEREGDAYFISICGVYWKKATDAE